MKKNLFISLILILNFGCQKDSVYTENISFEFDFNSGYEGWEGGFADYPVDNQMELEHDWRELPEPLDIQKSLFITGDNQSDDLFMFFKKKFIGLQPNTSYSISFDIEFASKYPTNAIGAGGSPGEAVVMKVGASQIEPLPLKSLKLGYLGYVMNIDKGGNSCEGKDMVVIGHIGVNDDTENYHLISNKSSNPFIVTSNSKGEIWAIVGTDSGFEGTTSIFYNRIVLNLQTFQ